MEWSKFRQTSDRKAGSGRARAPASSITSAAIPEPAAAPGIEHTQVPGDWRSGNRLPPAGSPSAEARRATSAVRPWRKVDEGLAADRFHHLHFRGDGLRRRRRSQRADARGARPGGCRGRRLRPADSFAQVSRIGGSLGQLQRSRPPQAQSARQAGSSRRAARGGGGPMRAGTQRHRRVDLLMRPPLGTDAWPRVIASTWWGRGWWCVPESLRCRRTISRRIPRRAAASRLDSGLPSAGRPRVAHDGARPSATRWRRCRDRAAGRRRSRAQFQRCPQPPGVTAIVRLGVRTRRPKAMFSAATVGVRVEA